MFKTLRVIGGILNLWNVGQCKKDSLGHARAVAVTASDAKAILRKKTLNNEFS